MIKTKIAMAVAVAASFMGFAQTTQAAVLTDIVMIVDESGSMGDVQANLRNNIGLFANILSAGGVDARYALVGYGNSSVVPRLLTNFTDAASFATAAQGLVASGGTEPGYTASAFALNALDGQTSLLNYRSSVIKNLIIFTDEPSNGDTIARGAVGGSAVTASVLDGLLTSNKALYNTVLSGTNTINSYQALATSHSGSVFNLAQLGSSNATVVNNFVTSFANTKLQETLDFCRLNPTDPACTGGGGSNPVPEPATLALLGLGVIGMSAGLRRKK